MIFYTNYLHELKFDFNESALVVVLERIVADFNFELGDVAVVFGTDDWLLTYNQNYLNHDYFTDIITFDYSTPDLISGDLLISVDRVIDNSVYLNVSRETELSRVCIHGLLHLVGFKDSTEKEKLMMREKENEYLSLLPN
ncbi:MAG: rRNA maturation RNase YbeY [Crocinitomicaceae bacterium]|nr:rRNA maturation RNase YbeY [Crocinitomicaceae bacterium]